MVLGVGERHSYRIKAKIRKEGVKGVVHGNRGRSCKWKLPIKTERQVVELAKGKYRGFNDHHLTEKIVEEEGIEICREKVRQILRSKGIASPRKRRAPKHRSRRERRASEGTMLQVDGSPHDWLEGREGIPAGSPQAKGRVERLWGTFQDRLVSELRLCGANSKQEAQAVLDRYLPQHNRRFAKSASEAKPAWREVDSKALEQALCFKYQRVVAKDNTVSFEGAVFQIPKGSPCRSYAGKRIDVHVLLDDSVEIFYKGDRIAHFDPKTARAIDLYRTNGRQEVFKLWTGYHPSGSAL